MAGGNAVLIQRALPGFGPPVRRRRRRWGVDPAQVEARATSDRAYSSWRQAFVGFLARLPEGRRAELKRRLNPPAPAQPRRLHHAA
jgi:hypothetical protein